jgi:uncharacterized protein YkwD
MGASTIREGGAVTRRRGSLGLLAAALIATAMPAVAGGLDREVLDEINYARTHPADYAQWLRGSGRDDDRHGERDTVAVEEAIEFLDQQPPLPPLNLSPALALAAADQTAVQGPRGRTGHQGSDQSSPSQRIHRRGVWSSRSAEAISYGFGTAAEVVRQLIIDDGVAGRGHRMTLFDPNLQSAGAGCGPHAIYRYMCVIDFAGAPVER